MGPKLFEHVWIVQRYPTHLFCRGVFCLASSRFEAHFLQVFLRRPAEDARWEHWNHSSATQGCGICGMAGMATFNIFQWGHWEWWLLAPFYEKCIDKKQMVLVSSNIKFGSCRNWKRQVMNSIYSGALKGLPVSNPEMKNKNMSDIVSDTDILCLEWWPSWHSRRRHMNTKLQMKHCNKGQRISHGILCESRGIRCRDQPDSSHSSWLRFQVETQQFWMEVPWFTLDPLTWSLCTVIVAWQWRK